MTDLELYHAIMSLQTGYAASLDEDRFEDWPNYFTEEALYQIKPRENDDLGLPACVMHCRGQSMMRDRVVSLRQANVYPEHSYRHFVSDLRILGREDGRITTRMNYMVVRAQAQLEVSLYQVGRYEDQLVETPEGLRYAERKAIFENARIKTLLVFPV